MFNIKTYKTKKTKNYIKKNRLVFFFNGVNKKHTKWVKTEQILKSINLNYFKIFNNALLIGIKTSIYCNINSSISNSIILIRTNQPENNLLKRIIFDKLETLMFLIITIKLNNKIYSKIQLKQITNLNYYDNTLILFRFFNVNLKISI